MEAAKKVIILNKLNSPLISQAIFILKDEGTDEFSAVTEAERIVEEFMYHNPASRHRLPVLPVIVTALAAAAIILLLLFQ